MTLICVCVTDDYVLHVSDRRLTWLDGSLAGQLEDDNANKAVLVCTQMVFAYTGLAQIVGSQRTDDWILDTLKHLKNPTLQKVLHQVKRQANRDFHQIRIAKEKKRHVFVAAGWSPVAQGRPSTPFVATVSNALSKSWKWESEARDSFKVNQVYIHDTSTPHVDWFGQKVCENIQEQVLSEVKRCVREGGGPRSIIEIIHLAFLTISNNQGENAQVGKNLMAISFPRDAAGQKGYFTIPLTNKFPQDEIVALYLWEGKDTGERFAPSMLACHPGGFLLLSGIRTSIPPRD